MPTVAVPASELIELLRYGRHMKGRFSPLTHSFRGQHFRAPHARRLGPRLANCEQSLQ